MLLLRTNRDVEASRIPHVRHLHSVADIAESAERWSKLRILANSATRDDATYSRAAQIQRDLACCEFVSCAFVGTFS
jgi:hypothetical protein